jgi:hypothetical protein
MGKDKDLDLSIIKRIRSLLDHPDKNVRSAAEIWAVEHSGTGNGPPGD